MTSIGAAGPPPMRGAELVSETASVNGTTLHYMRGGGGPTVLLIHGFPQDWYEWRAVIPHLTSRFSVVAVDLRGVGGSAAPATGYDTSRRRSSRTPGTTCPRSDRPRSRP